MQIFEGQCDLAYVEQRCSQIECASASHVREQLSAGHVVQEHVEKLIGVVCPMELYDKGMFDRGQNVLLTLHVFSLCAA
jgi:hypothetical protein